MSKSIKVNAIFNGLYKLLNIMFPLVTSMYLARVLTPDGIGEVAYAQNIVSYFSTVAALGIPNYGIREIAKVAKSEKRNLNKVFSELFIINAFSTILCSVSYYCMIILCDYYTNKYLYSVCGLIIVFNFFNIDWFYQGEEEFKYIAVRSFIIKVIALVLTCFWIKNENDYILYAVINCIALGGNYILNICHSRKYVSFTFKGLEIRKHMKSIMIMLATVISVEIYTQVDTTMLGIMCNSTVVAYYTYAMKIVKLISTVTSAIAAVILPRLSYYYYSNDTIKFNELVDKITKFLLVLCLAACIGFFFVADDIILIMYGKEYVEAIVTMRILIPLIAILAIGNLYGTQVLITVGEEKKLLYSTIVGALINFILNYFLIIKFKQNGAAVASVISELMVMILQIIWSFKFLEKKINIRFIGSLMFSLALLFGVEILLYGKINNAFISIIINVSMGVVVYFLGLLISHNEISIIILNYLKENFIKIKEKAF